MGGGYVGLYTALGLQKRLKRELRDGTVSITVVDPQPVMTYQPFLPEAAAGSIEPRHVVVPLRPALPGCTVVTGAVIHLDHAARTATIRPHGGADYRLDYDIVVMAAGSVSRVLPIPGLAEVGIGFKTIGEAIALRNHVLSRLDAAVSLDPSPQYDGPRAQALTFIVVGGGYAGVEALAELEDMARYAARFLPAAPPMRWVLVEAADRIMPEVSPRMSDYVLRELRARGIEVLLRTRLQSAIDGQVVLSDGQRFAADTVVWTAGVKANPLLAATDLPRDARGRLDCSATLQVRGVDAAFAAGDIAAVPDLAAGPDLTAARPEAEGEPFAVCGPSAQHAVRQARLLARNVAAALHGRELREYRHKYAGSVASLGRYRGVAEIYGVRLRGFPAWWMHRTYHVAKMPTLNRKLRIIADWTAGLLLPREVASLGQLEHPRREFERAAS